MKEKVRILEMVENGTLSADEASELMNTLGIAKVPQYCKQADAPMSDYDARLLRVVVDEQKTGDKANIRLPIGVMKTLLKISGKVPLPEEKMRGVDVAEMLDTVSECLDSQADGDFINITGPDGTQIRIYVE